jgi:hypothetical protein
MCSEAASASSLDESYAFGVGAKAHEALDEFLGVFLQGDDEDVSGSCGFTEEVNASRYCGCGCACDR